MKQQPWIASRGIDLGFIIGPAFAVTAAVVLFRDKLAAVDGTPPWLWLLLVVGVDVSHVYSTLFRTYLDREELKKRQMLYTLAPLLAWVGGAMLYSIDAIVFWRVLAYLAVFHFMRQQYGFMMIYSRAERDRPQWTRKIDQAVIYLATLFPLAYWHVHHRAFSWFVTGDFFRIDLPQLGIAAGALFAIALLAYAAKEIRFSMAEKNINAPKHLLLLGTAISWGVGIVVFNSDLAFTATNVIAHGIPYMALIWVFGRNQRDLEKTPYVQPRLAGLFQWKFVPIYILMLFLLAFVEEGLWDVLVWREHPGIFAAFRMLPQAGSEDIMVWLIPLLAMPQAVHYILDAFIWKHDLKDSEWKKILFYQKSRAA